MNWNRLQSASRIAIRIVLVVILLSVTFLQLMKYREENTNIRNSYDDDKGYLELPSFTICPMYTNDKKQENRNFEEYMEGVLNVTDFFDEAGQYVFLPGKQNYVDRTISKQHDYEIGLLKDNIIWKNSFFLSQWPSSILIPCLTLDPPEKTISKPQRSDIDLSVNFTELARKLSVEKFDQIYVELHSKDQSKMNQGWSYHDLYSLKIRKNEWRYLEPSINRNIKTKNYNCYENNDMKQTNCLNNFYMSKMNCSFPWLVPTLESKEKCGAKNFIKDLEYLIDDVAKGKCSEVQFPNLKGKNLSEDVRKCLIPNCLSTTWKILRQESFVLENDYANIEFRFDSGQKIGVIGESLDFTGLDLLMAFGGYLGLFIGASILSLYDISISFFMKLVTKIKSRGDSEISFTTSKKVFSTPLRISPVEVELEDHPILIKMKEDLAKQGETIKKLEKLLAK